MHSIETSHSTDTDDTKIRNIILPYSHFIDFWGELWTLKLYLAD